MYSSHTVNDDRMGRTGSRGRCHLSTRAESPMCRGHRESLIMAPELHEDMDYTVDAFVRVVERMRSISPIWKKH